MNMIPGIKWIRSRQRALARAALALFALAWLQAAIVPCTMAFATDNTPGTQSPRVDAHEGHGRGHDGHAGHDSGEAQVTHCPYCPPAQDGRDADCDHAAACAFPHDPRVDARALTAFIGPPPGQFLDIGSRLDAPVLRICASEVPRDVPRRPLAIRYCRFIE